MLTVETRPCGDYNQRCLSDRAWADWNKCSGARFECDYPREQKRFRKCFPNCVDSRDNESEARLCDLPGCARCCPEFISHIPNGIGHHDRRLIFRLQTQLGTNPKTVYQGFDEGGNARMKYLVFGYGQFWVHSNNVNG